MKFYEKLPKKRKENNLSQEQLADRLGVSRQAVSKWESGLSYPDMEKILEICKILNCTLDELMDDGVINKDIKSNNTDLNYLDTILKYITKIYNMFLAMTFKEKVKCIFEIVVIGFVLSIISVIIMYFTNNLLSSLASHIDIAFSYILIDTILTILEIFLVIISIIITYHIFKVRYLNYYVTIEDSNINKKIIEKEVKEYKPEIKKEKVIIRDPKDSSNNFVDFLGKIFHIILSIIIFFLFIPAIFTFIGLIGSSIIAFIHIQYHILFLWTAIALIGGSIIVYVVLNGFFSLIFKKIFNLKINFILFISSLIIIAISGGFITSEFLNIEYIQNENKNDKINILSKEYNYEEVESFLNDYINYNITYYNTLTTLDNTYDSDKILIEVETTNDIEMPENYFDVHELIYYDNYDFNEWYDLFLKNIKDDKIIVNYDEYNLIKINIKISEENYNKIKQDFN